MAKVKMGDIKSGSENVKNVFRKAMSARTSKWLEKQTFSNDELLEILDITQNIEYHKENRYFYQKLIQSQKGPFDARVFHEYLDKLFHIDSMLNLLENTTSTNQEDKLKWQDYMMVSSTHWAVFNFFSRDAGIPYGIDVTKKPFRFNYAHHIVRYADKMGRGQISQEYFDELHRILDTMSEDEMYEWYLEAVASTYEKRAVDFLMSYDKMTPKALEHYWNKTTLINKEKLALHPNTPKELKMELFEETGNEDFLPQETKDMFMF